MTLHIWQDDGFDVEVSAVSFELDGMTILTMRRAVASISLKWWIETKRKLSVLFFWLRDLR